jgi:Zinc carboxypeptidase
VRRRLATLLALVVLAPLGAVAPADAASSPPAPPWCGTPEPDVAGAKGNIPYYAIKCTLDQIQAESNGRIKTRVIGHSTLGRPMYAVTVDARNTAEQRRNSDRYWQIEDMEIRDPARAQKLLRSFGSDVKVPVFYQANIHGNETESTDASIQFLREVATTPYGEDPAVDKVLDYGLFVFNITQNPDGRVLGNANKIDMNRDYLTQSQPEVRASVAAMRDLHPVLTVDMHGYYNPTEVDGETLPHNPGLEYDLIMPFNEGRVQRQKTALNAAGYPVQIPRSDWCPDGDFPDENDLCSDGSTQSPKTAQGFDDYGPFYTAVYGNLTGLDGTTPEMCGSNSNPTSGCATLPGAPAGTPTGRLGSVLNAYTNIWSSAGSCSTTTTRCSTRSSSRSAAAPRARSGGRAARSRSAPSTTGRRRTRAHT